MYFRIAVSSPSSSLQGVKSPNEACALGGGGAVYALLKQLIQNKTLIKLFYEPLVI